MSFYIGIDVGTSGTKALLMDPDGAVLATAASGHDVATPRPGWSEQDPKQWWSAACKAVRAALRKAGVAAGQAAGIGLSGQMHGLVLTDAAGEPLRPAIIWNDQRSGPQAERIEREVGGREALVRLVGNGAMTSFTLTKLLWVREHEPAVYERARHLLLPKDYVRLRLTGEYVGDMTDMSGTLLLDQGRRRWSPQMCERFEIDRDLLPPVVESHAPAGTLRKDAARRLGLPAGVPVVAGGGDQPVGAVGCGVVAPGRVSAVIGTSGVMYAHAPRYTADPASRVNTFCSCVAGQWCVFGCVLAAGGSLQWFRDVLGGTEVRAARRRKVDPYELLTEQAAGAAPGSGGVFWLPYLTGERTPHADPNARGGWIGIHAGTTRGELIRAVLEGVTFGMADALEALRARGLGAEEIRLSGGGARSALWRKMQADVYDAACRPLTAEEGPAYGAALLAAVGSGRFADVPEACDATVRLGPTHRPDAAAAAAYRPLHKQYRRLYPALREEFARIAALAGGA